MSIEQKRVFELLETHGARLVRHRKHRIYRLRDGSSFTMPSSPSDWRSWKNALSNLRRVLGIKREAKQSYEQAKRPYSPSLREPESDYSFLTGVTLPSMKDQLKEMNAMVNGNGISSGNGNEIFIRMGECFACGKQWSMPVGEHLWHEGKIKADPSWRMPTRCKECREKREPVTVEVKPGITVTTHVQSYKLPGRESKMRQEQPAPAQPYKNPRRSGVALRPSVLAKLRAIPLPHIGTTQLASLLGTSAATLYKWVENRKMPVLDGSGQSKYDPMMVAEWLEQNHGQWEVEEGYEIPRDACPTVPAANHLTMPPPAPSQPAAAPEAANETEKLSERDLLTLASLLLDVNSPNQPMLGKFVAELRSRFGNAQPSREVLKWMIGSAA